ncbi:MAG: response regulator [Clostridia bacterium]|nr:response regulator [Clostridia bacterium]
MFNLIIVDDEAVAIDSLRTLVKYEDFGFNLIADFTSGTEAIEFIKNNTVHAVISDIKMDDTDGFDLAEFCHQNFPDIQIAFMSAYRDFEYAKKAMSYHIAHYITKPFVYEEFVNVLKSFYSILSKKLFLPYSNFVDNSFLMDCQRLFSDLFCNIITDISEFEERLSFLDLDIDSSSSKSALFNLHIENFKEYISQQWKHEDFRLYNAIESIVPFSDDLFYTFSILYSKANIEFLIISKKDCPDFEHIIKKHIEKICSNLNNLLKLNVSYDILSVYSSFSDIMSSGKQADNTQKVIQDDTLSMALTYIEKNFAQINSIDDVAKYVALSPAYFGAFFKQHTGDNFNNYLNKIKIEKAKKLISDDADKISNICYLVGYNSPRYFYKMFKQYTNMTPTQYKENLHND